MTVDVAVIAATFVLILPAELPDKTMVATLVLATRYRPWPVWVGASGAFVVQSAIAVIAGGLVARLPHRPVLAVTSALFATGAVILFSSARRDPTGSEEEAAEEVAVSRWSADAHSNLRIAMTAFAVLFAAEWGDLSQLLTAGLAARYDDPLSVFIGATSALVLIAGIAVVAGRGLLRVLPVPILRRAAGTLFAVLAVITALEAAGIDVGVG